MKKFNHVGIPSPVEHPGESFNPDISCIQPTLKRVKTVSNGCAFWKTARCQMC